MHVPNLERDREHILFSVAANRSVDSSAISRVASTTIVLGARLEPETVLPSARRGKVRVPFCISLVVKWSRNLSYWRLGQVHSPRARLASALLSPAEMQCMWFGCHALHAPLLLAHDSLWNWIWTPVYHSEGINEQTTLTSEEQLLPGIKADEKLFEYPGDVIRHPSMLAHPLLVPASSNHSFFFYRIAYSSEQIMWIELWLSARKPSATSVGLNNSRQQNYKNCFVPNNGAKGQITDSRVAIGMLILP